MSSVADSIRRGLEQALAYARGEADLSRYRVHVRERVDVKAIRQKLGMTQVEFAATFGFNVNTLRHWEHGKREPVGPARAYLTVIERDPEAVRRALRGPRSAMAGGGRRDVAGPVPT
jgi:putative transcriptional regulator